MTHSKFINDMRLVSSNYFKKNGYYTEEKRKYILRNWGDWKNNIINDYGLIAFLESEISRHKDMKKPFPLHKYVHHGLSSQACLFNLFGPIIARANFSLLKNIILLSGIKLKGDINKEGIEFEFSDKNLFREKGQPTSIDLYVKTNTSEHVFVEFKFTESEFGTCSVYRSGDCDGTSPKNDKMLCYLHKNVKCSYLDLMEKYDLFTNDQYCLFIEFYQAYRLLLFSLEKNGYFLLIHDERNPSFLMEKGGVNRGLFKRFRQLLPKDILKRVYILSIQEIVTYLNDTSDNTWLRNFKERYALF
jgi:Restriction Endonuclease associating with ARP